MTTDSYTFVDYSLPIDQYGNDWANVIHANVIKFPSEPSAPNLTEKMNLFVDGLIQESRKGFTQNNSPTFISSGDKCLDFFFETMENTKSNRILQLLQESWNSNPEQTLRIIANLRDVREGKAIRYQTYLCWYWLYENHPQTLYNNLENFTEVGYLKDLLNLVVIIAFRGHIGKYVRYDDDPSMVKNKRKTIKQKKRDTIVATKKLINIMAGLPIDLPLNVKNEIRLRKKQLWKQMKQQPEKEKVKVSCSERKERKTDDVVAKKQLTDEELEFWQKKITPDIAEKHKIREIRREFAKERFSTDPKYRMFLCKVADIFAQKIIKDINALKSGQISFAAKWAPSLKKYHDKYTHIASLIALRLKELENKSYNNADSDVDFVLFTHLARDDYRKLYVKLRKASKLPELFISMKDYSSIDYNRISAKAFQKYKAIFLSKDVDRFSQFISSRKRVGGKSLKPVEIVREIIEDNESSLDNSNSDYNGKEVNPLSEEVLQKQWNSLVDNIGKSTVFSNSVCVCDVSGSMHGTPMYAAIGLTLLTCQTSISPWDTVCISFSETPTVYEFTSKKIKDCVLGILKSEWGYNTNFDAVMELILRIGDEKQLSQEQMPEVLFVFTDMEFDQAFNNPDKTNFQIAKEKFESKGYRLPSVVFWNLRGTKSTPVTMDENGVLLLSGYSDKLLKILFQAGVHVSNLTPLFMMKQVTAHYSNFKVYD